MSELAPLQDWNAHRPEVIRTCHAVVRAWQVSGVGRRLALNLEASPGIPFEGQVSNSAHRHHPGDRADVLLDILAEARQPGRARINVFLRNRHLHGEDVLGVEAGIDAQQSRHTLDHEPGAAQHHQRQRDLRRYEPMTQAVSPTLSRSTTAFFQGFVDVSARRAECRHDAEENARQAGDEQGKTEHAGVDPEGIDSAQWKVHGIKPEHTKQQRRAPDRQKQANQAAQQRQHQTFRHQLPCDAGGRGA